METLNLILGLYDDPENQTQSNYEIDLISNNIAIFGSSMSGKTTLLKTILLRIHQVVRITRKEEIYILDFNNSLSIYQKLPYVIGYFDALNEENVRRLFKIINERFDDNLRSLPGISYAQYSQNSQLNQQSKEPCHITFIIDGLNAFLADDRYIVYHDMLHKLSRDGLSKGISIVFTATDISGGVARFLTLFNQKIAFDLPREQYNDLFAQKIEKPISIKGRGIAYNGTNCYEFQAYYPYDIDNRDYKENGDYKAIVDIYKNLLNSATDASLHDEYKSFLSECTKRKLKSFSGELYHDNLNEYCDTSKQLTEVILGVDYYSFEPIKIDLYKAKSVAIYGKKAFGKTNLLSLILRAARKIDNVRYVLWEDGRNGLLDSLKAQAVYNEIEYMQKHSPNNVVILRSINEFESYIRKNGYYNLPEKPNEVLDDMKALDEKIGKYRPHSDLNDASDIKDYLSDTNEISDVDRNSNIGLEQSSNPFTVFIVQSKLFYQKTPGGISAQLIPRVEPFICNEDPRNPKLFIFSDVQKIADSDNNTYFNNCINHAFLLHDIVRFINNKGQNSIFGHLDIEELKENFGKCELGDGFYLNLETDDLKKIKFIKNISCETKDGESDNGRI